MKSVRIITTVLVFLLALSVPAFASEAEVRDISFENSLAGDLKALGLFSGVSENNFDLERVPTRTEVLVMLIRVLGAEKAALEGSFEHPFTDVPEWADKYVGYAYENSLTKGVSPTKFGNDNANGATYLTFMLRALGYSDAEGDFNWDSPFELAKGLGLLPGIVDTENFIRADIVTVSYAALSVNLKGTVKTLGEKLIDANAFDADVYNTSYKATKLTDKENSTKTALAPEELYRICSTAAFDIVAYDADGAVCGEGSGFFIDESGIAVTDYWNICDSASAEITLFSTGAKHKVSGVYDFSANDDWALIKIDGSGFSSLKINAMPAKGGASVYTIGSPNRLGNTVSEGIISNPRNTEFSEGFNAYIQNTAPVSNGSYGGALINSYGEVIAIVADSDADGQNINFATPIAQIAAAKTDNAVPLADTDWNQIYFLAGNQNIILSAEKVFMYDFDYGDYTTGDLELTATSSDPSVASALLLPSYGLNGTVRIVGYKSGTVTVTIANNLTKDVLELNVTVIGDLSTEKPTVVYDMLIQEMRLSPGAQKLATLTVTEFLLSDAPSGLPEANYSVSSSHKNLKAKLEQIEGTPYFTLTLSLDKSFWHNTGSIVEFVTISNDKTEDTLKLSVMLGNVYGAAYRDFAAVIKDNGVLVEEGEDKYYALAGGAEGNSLTFIYYPEENELGIIFNNSIYGAFALILNEKGDAAFMVSSPSLAFSGDGVINKNVFGTKTDSIDFINYEGAADIRTMAEEFTTQMLLTIIYTLDNIILPVMCPGTDISDFGFVNIDYSIIGI